MNNYNNTSYKLNFQKALQQLSSFIHIPSVSAEPKHKADILTCANWLKNHLQQIGLEHVKTIPTNNHPVVYADWLHAADKPIVLIYGHYDVQPADPLNEWKSDPFSGEIKNDYIYGRGSSDDKGQMFAHIKAIEYFLSQFGELPVSIKCVFEGEEEIGSPGLKEFIQQHPDFLKADTAVVSDMSIPSPDQPAITYSLRGMLSLELKVTGQKTDLHSGTFGGAIYNPIHALCEMIATLHDKNGRITIPGFYDNMINKSNKEKAYMKSVGRSNRKILQDAGSECGWGEEGFSLYERIATRPSLSVNGIKAGYYGEGPKAIIPSSALAKISFRLIPGQDPDRIEVLFRNYINQICPPCLKTEIKKYASAKPVIINPDNIFIKAAAKAYDKIFGKKPVFLGSGGTIPIVNLLQEYLCMPVILMGFALPDDNPHGPNEKFLLSNFYKAILTSIAFLKETGKMYQKQQD
jgi:acetylornithine deacetylase/succinyl-diaminopimelate desuccinylase-like protein